MKKILFIDRDGTPIVEPTDTFQIDSLLEIYPGSSPGWAGSYLSWTHTPRHGDQIRMA
ncbi:MAG: hypothetical protein IPI77_17255 [Saprospiraceae bacterium]|nr:hypothetical protein [Saprospiraceae bacterium]